MRDNTPVGDVLPSRTVRTSITCWEDLDRPFPKQRDRYMARQIGACLKPALSDGDWLIVDRRGVVDTGDLVIVHPAPGSALHHIYGGSPLVKVFVCAWGDGMEVAWIHPREKRFTVAWNDLQAVHRVSGVIAKPNTAREWLRLGGDFIRLRRRGIVRQEHIAALQDRRQAVPDWMTETRAVPRKAIQGVAYVHATPANRQRPYGNGDECCGHERADRRWPSRPCDEP